MNNQFIMRHITKLRYIFPSFCICLVLYASSNLSAAKHKVQKGIDSNALSRNDSPLTTPPIKEYNPLTLILIICGIVTTIGLIAYSRLKRKKHINTITVKNDDPDPVTDTIDPPSIFANEAELDLSSETDISNGQTEVVLSIFRSLDTYHDHGDSISFRGIDGEVDVKTIRNILIDAVMGKGGMIEFIQCWLVASYKNELILLASKQFSTTSLLESIKHNSFDDEEESDGIDERSKPKPLTTIFPIKAFSVHSNGHYLRWQANESLLRVYKNLVNWTFAENMLKMSEHDFDEAFLTNDFYKNKVFSNDGSANGENYINSSDVKDAEDVMRTRNKPIPPTHDVKRKDSIIVDYSGHAPYDPVLESIKAPTKEIPKQPISSKNIGKLYPAILNAGYPLATISKGRVFPEILESGYPIGTLCNGKVFQGILNSGVPLATIINKKIYPGMLKAGMPLATINDGKICKSFIKHGYPIATYVGDNEDEGLAAAFLLGLI